MTAILKIILSKLWPALIPLVIYLLWLVYARITHKEGKKPRIGDGKFKEMVYSMIALTFLTFAFLLFTIENKDEDYVPTSFEDGKLVPSKVRSE